MEDKKQELRNTAKTMLDDPIITMAYVEHQMDLISQLIIDLSESASLAGPALERLNMLKSIMEHASIDFNNLSHPLQSYKIPKTIEHKDNTRKVSGRYLNAQIREGVFGA